MAEKQIKVDRSKIDYGSDLGQRIKTTVELEQSERKLLFRQSVILLCQDFSQLPWGFYCLLGLIIIILGVVLPFIIRSISANLGIPPVICFAVILLVSELFDLLNSGIWLNRLVVLGSFVLILCPPLIQLVTNTLAIPQWLSATVILLYPITLISEAMTLVSEDRDGVNIYGLQKIYLPINLVVNVLEFLYIPLYVVFSNKGRYIYQPWLWWWLKNHRRKDSSTPEDAYEFIPEYEPKQIGINVIGGLVPITIAGWQFARVAVSPILLVTVVTTALFYFMVKVIADSRISIGGLKAWGIVMGISILAIWIDDSNSKIAIAYAGITFGTLIGADLLHLKYIRPEQAVGSLCIGGAGSKDGIALFGLYVILTIELWEQVVSLISGR